MCPACSTPGTGRFCASCGASLNAADCASCRKTLAAGAKFCHACGHPVGNATRPAGRESAAAATGGLPSLTWAVMGVAAIALIALIAYNSARTNPANSAAVQQMPLEAQAGGGVAPGAVVRGPDISELSTQEQADRLFNRVMLLANQGKTDSVMFFAPMAISAYQMLSPLNADQRYDMGRVAEVAGVLPMAKAQADSILALNPTHLLGLALGARVASLEKNRAALRSFENRIISSYETEMAKRLPEYERHSADITSALAEARRSASGTQ